MKNALIVVTAGACLGLVLTLCLSPSWPVAVALVSVLAAAVAVFAALLWSERDARLDAAARKRIETVATESTELREVSTKTWKSLGDRIESLETRNRVQSAPNPFTRAG